jgi:hypothetical protein
MEDQGGFEPLRTGQEAAPSPIEKFTNAGIVAGNLTLSLPETTVCRSTEGDQYRISGLPYVLAGATVLNSNHFMPALHAVSPCPRLPAGFDRVT